MCEILYNSNLKIYLIINCINKLTLINKLILKNINLYTFLLF